MCITVKHYQNGGWEIPPNNELHNKKHKYCNHIGGQWCSFALKYTHHFSRAQQKEEYFYHNTLEIWKEQNWKPDKNIPQYAHINEVKMAQAI